MTIELRPTIAAARELAARHIIRVSITIVFIPAGGAASTRMVNLDVTAPRGRRGHR